MMLVNFNNAISNHIVLKFPDTQITYLGQMRSLCAWGDFMGGFANHFSFIKSSKGTMERSTCHPVYESFYKHRKSICSSNKQDLENIKDILE